MKNGCSTTQRAKLLWGRLYSTFRPCLLQIINKKWSLLSILSCIFMFKTETLSTHSACKYSQPDTPAWSYCGCCSLQFQKVQTVKKGNLKTAKGDSNRGRWTQCWQKFAVLCSTELVIYFFLTQFIKLEICSRVNLYCALKLGFFFLFLWKFGPIRAYRNTGPLYTCRPESFKPHRSPSSPLTQAIVKVNLRADH